MFRLEFTNHTVPPLVLNEELQKNKITNENKQGDVKKPSRINMILSKSRGILTALGMNFR